MTPSSAHGGSSFDPFRIDVPQSDLDDLHDRLDRIRWPDELPGWAGRT
ncbi:hypothetical protein M2271_006349 [Streptomyces sp. LBL]|nr:epoxide hydrolase N-terminal domain-containing protein [Streptomyces sp. LBL]MDH6628516.1 hypothetical protein [Streptomyces sp. LBL]